MKLNFALDLCVCACLCHCAAAAYFCGHAARVCGLYSLSQRIWLQLIVFYCWIKMLFSMFVYIIFGCGFLFLCVFRLRTQNVATAFTILVVIVVVVVVVFVFFLFIVIRTHYFHSSRFCKSLTKWKWFSRIFDTQAHIHTLPARLYGVEIGKEKEQERQQQRNSGIFKWKYL